jgi:hypothetical protein
MEPNFVHQLMQVYTRIAILGATGPESAGIAASVAFSCYTVLGARPRECFFELSRGCDLVRRTHVVLPLAIGCHHFVIKKCTADKLKNPYASHPGAIKKLEKVFAVVGCRAYSLRWRLGAVFILVQ